MKKNNYWIACFLLVVAQFRAQYFQGKYGQDVACGATGMNGMITRSTGDGHLLGGLYINTWGGGGCNNFAFFVTRTGYSGVFTNPNEFNNFYNIMDAAGNLIRISSSQVVEYSDGTGYGVIFTYFPLANGVLCPGTGPGTLGVSALGFVRLDIFGNVMNSMGYTIPTNGTAYTQAIIESPTVPGQILATGNFGSGENQQLWAVCIDQAGTLIWGNLYYNASNAMTPYDLVNPVGSPDVVIVGSTSANGTTTDAFMLYVNLISGIPFRCNVYDIGTVDKFQAIKRSATGSYIVAGYTDTRPWLMRCNSPGVPSFWQVLKVPVRDVNGLVERQNTSGNYEYYIGASMTTGKYNSDPIVIKVDQNFNPINPNSVFIYNTGAEETVTSVDVNTSGTWDGVSLYGVVEGSPNPTNREGFIVKSYFNGITTCNQSFMNADVVYKQLVTHTMAVSRTAIGPSYSFGGSVISNCAWQLLCNDFQVPGGDNSRIAATTGVNTISADAEMFNVFPNPCSANEHLKLQLPSQKEETVTIKITNLLGSVVMAEQASLIAGSNQVMLNLANARLASGMYQVSIENDAGIKTQKLIVK